MNPLLFVAPDDSTISVSLKRRLAASARAPIIPSRSNRRRTAIAGGALAAALVLALPVGAAAGGPGEPDVNGEWVKLGAPAPGTKIPDGCNSQTVVQQLVAYCVNGFWRWYDFDVHICQPGGQQYRTIEWTRTTGVPCGQKATEISAHHAKQYGEDWGSSLKPDDNQDKGGAGGGNGGNGGGDPPPPVTEGDKGTGKGTDRPKGRTAEPTKPDPEKKDKAEIKNESFKLRISNSDKTGSNGLRWRLDAKSLETKSLETKSLETKSSRRMIHETRRPADLDQAVPGQAIGTGLVLGIGLSGGFGQGFGHGNYRPNNSGPNNFGSNYGRNQLTR